MKINTFTYRGKDIEMTFRNGSLAYTFEHEGKTYGQALKLPSRSVMDIASITFLLVQNAIETMESLKITN